MPSKLSKLLYKSHIIDRWKYIGGQKLRANWVNRVDISNKQILGYAGLLYTMENVLNKIFRFFSTLFDTQKNSLV